MLVRSPNSRNLLVVNLEMLMINNYNRTQGAWEPLCHDCQVFLSYAGAIVLDLKQLQATSSHSDVHLRSDLGRKNFKVENHHKGFERRGKDLACESPSLRPACFQRQERSQEVPLEHSPDAGSPLQQLFCSPRPFKDHFTFPDICVLLTTAFQTLVILSLLYLVELFNHPRFRRHRVCKIVQMIPDAHN